MSRLLNGLCQMVLVILHMQRETTIKLKKNIELTYSNLDIRKV